MPDHGRECHQRIGGKSQLPRRAVVPNQKFSKNIMFILTCMVTVPNGQRAYYASQKYSKWEYLRFYIKLYTTERVGELNNLLRRLALK